MSSRSKRAIKLTARETAELALMSALMVSTQLAMSFLPNIHLTAVLIVVTAVTFGWDAMYSVLVYVVIEGIMYGFGVWWFSYLYAWPLLCAAAVLLRKNDSRTVWAIVTGTHGLCFGALCALPYVFISGMPAAVSYWISGIPFDLLHCAGNFTLTFLLVKPLIRTAAKMRPALPSGAQAQ
jgi:energy-coupling factor transport system substrate-specific component